jgi:hypothetical protein
MEATGRQRAADYAAERAARAGMSAAALAAAADLDPSTVRDFLDGTRWPRTGTRAAIEEAMGLTRGTFDLIARGAYTDPAEDEVERAVKASPLSRANQHKLIGAYYDMLEAQERGSA